MGSNVLAQMVGSHELLSTLIANESLLTRVCSSVSLEFITACEALVACRPVTDKRFVPRMASQMRPEMACLPVGLRADMAYVQAGSLVTSSVPSAGCAIRACACNSLCLFLTERTTGIPIISDHFGAKRSGRRVAGGKMHCLT